MSRINLKDTKDEIIIDKYHKIFEASMNNNYAAIVEKILGLDFPKIRELSVSADDDKLHVINIQKKGKLKKELKRYKIEFKQIAPFHKQKSIKWEVVKTKLKNRQKSFQNIKRCERKG